MSLPLTGLKVVEFAGLAPVPFAGMILADAGATVIRIDKLAPLSVDILCRGKRSLAINPKTPTGLAVLKKLVSEADVLIDPFRPDVMERLGLGPTVFLGHEGLNEKLIYARIVGFPRTGPHRDMAGHDINYLALSGVLSMFPGSPDKPTFPLNLVSDFAGGGLTCVLGILLALVERGISGRGQIVDTDMVSGTRFLSTFPLLHTLIPQSPLFSGSNPRQTNILDGGAPFYAVYTCKDGGWMSVGCLEPQFYSEFIQRFTAALPDDFLATDPWRPLQTQMDRAEWPRLKGFLERGFMTAPRDYWAQTFHGTDACAVPVLTPTEATSAHSRVPSPHPHLSRTPSTLPIEDLSKTLNLRPGQHTYEILEELGVDAEQMKALIAEGAILPSKTILQAKL